MKDVGEAVQNAVTTATVGAAFLNPLSMRNQPTAPSDRGASTTLACIWWGESGAEAPSLLSPDALVVLAVPPSEKWGARAEAAQDAGATVLAAAAALLSSYHRKDEKHINENKHGFKQ